MKTCIFTLITFTLLLSHKGATAQNYDSLTRRILKIEGQQRHIQMNISKSHKQFSTGSMFLVGGFATTVIAAILYDRGIHNTDNSDNIGRVTPSPALLCIGGGLMAVGTVIQIDSHKWFGRAGRRK